MTKEFKRLLRLLERRRLLEEDPKEYLKKYLLPSKNG